MDTHLCNFCDNLIDTVWLGHVTCVKKFIANGDDLNITDMCGRTALHWATDLGKEEIVNILIAAGANLNCTDTGGRTPLELSVNNQADECFNAFISAGANANIANKLGITPLHKALRLGRHAYIQTLIDAGADPNIADRLGETPLHTAVRYERDIICLKKLIDSGANPGVADIGGETPLQLAIRNKNKKCVHILVVRLLSIRSLTTAEWNIIPENSEIGHLLPVVMTRDGRYSAAKLVSKLPAEKRKVIQTAMMCLSRFLSHDLVERIVVQCV